MALDEAALARIQALLSAAQLPLQAPRTMEFADFIV